MTTWRCTSRSTLRADARRGRAVAAGGFTLVELLAAMATVAVLLALLLPGLRGVRDAARAAACASNLRQLGVALHAYAHDARGHAAPAARDFRQNLHRWHGVRERTSQAFAPVGPAGQGSLTPYLGEEGMAHADAAAPARACPAFDALRAPAGPARGFERSNGGYGYNQTFVGVVRTRDAAQRLVTDRSGAGLHLFERPERTLAFSDAAFFSPGAMGELIEYSFLEPPFQPGFSGSDRPRFDPSMHFRHGGPSGSRNLPAAAASTGDVGAPGAGPAPPAASLGPARALAVHLDGHAGPLARGFTWFSGVYGVPRFDHGLGWPEGAVGAADAGDEFAEDRHLFGAR